MSMPTLRELGKMKLDYLKERNPVARARKALAYAQAVGKTSKTAPAQKSLTKALVSDRDNDLKTPGAALLIYFGESREGWTVRAQTSGVSAVRAEGLSEADAQQCANAIENAFQNFVKEFDAIKIKYGME